MSPVRLASIVILSLGMAGAFAVGSVVGRLGRLPHVLAPDRLLHVTEIGARGQTLALRLDTLGHWARHGRSIASVAGYNRGVRDVPLVSDGRAVVARTVLATRNFFDVLGVVPARGATGDIGIVLSHDFWVRHFQRDEAIVGRAVSLEGVMGWRVLGIAPPAFHFPMQTDIWQLSFELETSDGVREPRMVDAIVRTRLGASDEQVETELAAFAARLPGGNPPAHGLRVTPATTLLGGRLRGPLMLLSVYSVAFLLVAIAGTIHLESMRRLAAAQAHAIRLALGATMRALAMGAVRQSVVTTACAAALALPLGIWIVTLLARLAPQLAAPVPTLDREWIVMAAVVAGPMICLAAAAAWHTRNLIASAPSLLSGQSPLSGQHRTIAPGMKHAVIQKAMIVASLAGATSVATYTVSAARQHARELMPDAGWDTSRVLMAEVAYPLLGRGDLPGRFGYGRYLSTTRTLADRLAALPGVAAVSLVERPIFSQAPRAIAVRRADALDAVGIEVTFELIGPAFFAALGVSPSAGREFTDDDRLPAAIIADSRLPRGPGHIIVSRTLARRLWGDVNPVGQAVAVAETFFKVRTVVGVVDDVRLRPVRSAERPVAYVPYLEQPTEHVAFVMRLDARHAPAGNAARDVLMSAGTDAALGVVELAAEANRRTAAPIRTVVALYVTVAAMTIAICMLTVYATIAYAVRQRGREWAVRLALGGRHTALVGRVTLGGLYLVAAGIVLGGVVAQASTSLVSATIQASALATIDIAAGSAVVLLAAVVACYVAAASIDRTNITVLLHS